MSDEQHSDPAHVEMSFYKPYEHNGDGDAPLHFADALDVVADFLDLGDSAFITLAQINETEIEISGVVQADLRDMADRLRSGPNSLEEEVDAAWSKTTNRPGRT
jgi:hypothetical protein